MAKTTPAQIFWHQGIAACRQKLFQEAGAVRGSGMDRRFTLIPSVNRPRLPDRSLPRWAVQNIFLGFYEGGKMRTRQTAPKTISAYIADFPPDVQALLEKIRLTIRKAAPDAEEAIKYQMPTFILNGNLVHFAAFKEHIGFYPTPTGIDKFKKALSVYEGAKGSVRFPLDKPIPFALISKIVKFRVKENLARAQTKGKKK
jgi:uncharacterized protein YdhG (YjbR/CyaY superfamily)